MDDLKVRWKHQSSHDPVILLSEIDSNRFEVRKVEIYADGRMGFANENASAEDTVLGEKAISSASEIARDSQFLVASINVQEFEEVWLAAIAGTRWDRFD